MFVSMTIISFCIHVSMFFLISSRWLIGWLWLVWYESGMKSHARGGIIN